MGLMVMNLTTGHQKKPVNGLCSPSSLRSSIITPGSSSKKKLMYKFKEYEDVFMKLPRKIGGQEIVGEFENREQFIDHLFPTLGQTDEIPESVVLTPKNKNMNEINELCLDRYRPDDDIISVKSRDKPYVPEEGK